MENSLADSIAMLEQILEVMPEDMDSLRALYAAHQQGGQAGKAFEYLNRMIDVVAQSGDVADTTFVVQELERFEATHPSEIAAQRARLRTLSASAEEASNTRSGKGSEASAQSIKAAEADISEELALAWRLYEEGQLSQEEYSSVLHDLTEVSSKELDVPASVLHVLNDRGFTQMNRIMNYMSSRSGVPCLSLASYELVEQVAGVLPLELSAHEGALPFAFFGNDLLVAVLNPFNNMLVDKVERVGGHRCHTFLVAPEDYDLALGRLRELAKQAA